MDYPDGPNVITGSLRSGREGPRDAMWKGLHQPSPALKMEEGECWLANTLKLSQETHVRLQTSGSARQYICIILSQQI